MMSHPRYIWLWFGVALVLLMATSLPVLADESGDPLGIDNTKGFGLAEGGTSKVGSILVAVVNLLLGLVGILALGAIVWGGIKYITSFGDEKGAHAGKDAIKYAIIGLLAAAGSFIIVRAVVNLLK